MSKFIKALWTSVECIDHPNRLGYLYMRLSPDLLDLSSNGNASSSSRYWVICFWTLTMIKIVVPGYLFFYRKLPRSKAPMKLLCHMPYWICIIQDCLNFFGSLRILGALLWKIFTFAVPATLDKRILLDCVLLGASHWLIMTWCKAPTTPRFLRVEKTPSTKICGRLASYHALLHPWKLKCNNSAARSFHPIKEESSAWVPVYAHYILLSFSGTLYNKVFYSRSQSKRRRSANTATITTYSHSKIYQDSHNKHSSYCARGVLLYTCFVFQTWTRYK